MKYGDGILEMCKVTYVFTKALEISESKNLISTNYHCIFLFQNAPLVLLSVKIVETL